MLSLTRHPRSIGAAVILLLAALAVTTGSAEAAKWKPKQPAKVAKATGGASGDASTADLPTSALVSHGPGGEAIGKDCFVVKKRALVPGTGYMIRRSTFCN